MYQGHLGPRHGRGDPDRFGPPLRERTELEERLLGDLANAASAFRSVLEGLGADSDTAAKGQALTKLDEAVMWAQRAIDR